MNSHAWLTELVFNTIESARANSGRLYPVTFLCPNRQYARSVMHHVVNSGRAAVGVRFETFAQYLHRQTERALLRSGKRLLNDAQRDLFLRKILQSAQLEYFTAAAQFADSYARYFGRAIRELQANLDEQQILSLAQQVHEPAVRDVVQVYQLYRERVKSFVDYSDLLALTGVKEGVTAIFPAFVPALTRRERQFVETASEKVVSIELPAGRAQPELHIQNPVHPRDEVRAVLRRIQAQGQKPSSIFICAPPNYHDLVLAEAKNLSVPVRSDRGIARSFDGARILLTVIEILEEDFPFAKLRRLLLLRRNFGQLRELYRLQVALGEKQLVQAMATYRQEQKQDGSQEDSFARLQLLVKRLIEARSYKNKPKQFLEFCLEHFVVQPMDRNLLSVMLGDLLESVPETDVNDLKDYLEQLADSLSESSEPSGIVLSAHIDAGLYEHVYLLGMTDHGFPVVVKEDPILPDTVREAINARYGVELKLARDMNRRSSAALDQLINSAAATFVASFPVLHLAEERTEQESFYFVDVVARITGNERLSQKEYSHFVQAQRSGPDRLSAQECLDDEDFLLRLKSPQAFATYYSLLSKTEPDLTRFVEAEQNRWSNQHNPYTGLLSQDLLKILKDRDHGFSATSDIERYMSCPYRYFLARILHLKPLEEPVATESMDALQKGRLVHEILYKYLTQKTRTRTQLSLIAKKTLQDYSEQHGSLHPIMVEKVELEIEEMLDVFRQFESTLPAAEQQEAEFSFGRSDQSLKVSIPLRNGELSLSGSIDRFDVYSDKIVVLDYKTGNRKNYTLEKAAMAQKLQPWLYAEALRQSLPAKLRNRPIETGYLALKENRDATPDLAPYDEAKRAELLQLLEYFAEALSAGLTVQTANACSECEFTPVCGSLVSLQCERKDITAQKKPVKELLMRYEQLLQAE
jgi:RecB family exonuclease